MTSQPDWLLERALVGEAPDNFVPESAALDALRASNDEILAELPPRAVAAEVERRAKAQREKRNRARLFYAGSALAAAAAVFLIIGRAGSSEPGENIDPAERDGEIRIKGDIRLLIFRKQADGAVRLNSSSVTRSGDLLQLSYVAAGRSHGAIVSIDGRGAVTLHSPETVDGPTRLAPGKAIPLAHSYRLDDAPRFERFFFVASSQPIDVNAVLTSAERLANSPQRETAALILGPHLEQISVLMRKSETP